GAAVGVALAIATLLAAMNPARTPAQAPGPGGASIEMFRGRPVVAGEGLVALRPNADRARLRAAVDADSDSLVGAGRFCDARSPRGNVASLINLLSARSDVLYAEPNYVLYAVREPNDPRFPELWGLRNLGQIVKGVAGVPGADIGAVPAWDKALGSRNVVVGI